jgi:hypothetical protein
MTEQPTTPPQPRGNRLLKLLGWVVVGAIILIVLFTTVFPWLERTLSTPTLGG